MFLLKCIKARGALSELCRPLTKVPVFPSRRHTTDSSRILLTRNVPYLITSSNPSKYMQGLFGFHVPRLNSTHGESASTAQTKREHEVDVDKELMRYNIEEFYPDDDEQSQDFQASTQTEESNSQSYTYEDFYGIEIREQHFKPDLEKSTIKSYRGQTGVFDVDDVVKLLEEHNMIDVCTIAIPPEFQYVEHLVIATGISKRHLQATSQHIQTQWKRRRTDGDPISIRADGKKTDADWIALDLRNVIVHLMLQEARQHYALESLWQGGEDIESTSIEDRYTFTLPTDAFPSDDPEDLFNQLHKQYFETQSQSHSLKSASTEPTQESWNALHAGGWTRPNIDNEYDQLSDRTQESKENDEQYCNSSVIDDEKEANAKQNRRNILKKHYAKADKPKERESMENIAGWHSPRKPHE